MLFAVRPIISFLVIALLAPVAFANSSAAVTSIATVQKPKKEGRIWSGLLNVARSTSLVDFKDGTKSDSMDYEARFNIKLNEDFTLNAVSGYSQDLNYPENNDFANSSLGLLRSPVKAGKRFLVGYRVSALLPTSKDAKIRQSLQTSLSTSLNVKINPERLIQGLDISGSLSVGRNIHQYETALDGRVNNQYTCNQSLGIGYSFASGISISADFLHRNSWSYQNVMRDTFEMTQEVGYELNPTFNVAIGHTNSGSSLKANGSDSNVQIVDENNSMVYGSLTATF